MFFNFLRVSMGTLFFGMIVYRNQKESEDPKIKTAGDNNSQTFSFPCSNFYVQAPWSKAKSQLHAIGVDGAQNSKSVG